MDTFNRTMLILACVGGLGVQVAKAQEPRADQEPSSEGAVDPDLERAMAEAEVLGGEGRTTEAAAIVEAMWSATDRFTVEQRPALGARGEAVLAQAAESETNPEAALRLRDGAWTVSGRQQDPAYAEELVNQAEGLSPERAAYLLHRATQVDPENQAAQDLLDSLTTNTARNWMWVTAALALVSAGAASLLLLGASSADEDAVSANTRADAQGLVDQAATMRFFSYLLFGVGTLAGGGTLVLYNMDDSVTDAQAPDYLPALAE